MKLIITLAAVSAAYSVNTLAQTERDLDSHVHGAASLNVAISDSSVFIELNTPWNNIVGFEHAPNTDDQRALVEKAMAHLNDPDHLFAFNAGDCALNEVDVETAMGEEHHSDDDHHDDHDADGDHKDEHHDDHDADGDHKDEHHDDHDADGDHKDEHHDDHDADGDHKDEHHDDHDADGDHKDEHHDDHDDHAEHEGESETHSAVLAIYSYECKQIADLNTIDATLFSLWSGFEELDVQLIGDNGQTLVELEPGNTVINLDQVK